MAVDLGLKGFKVNIFDFPEYDRNLRAIEERGSIEAIGNLADCQVEHNNAYPGWKPNPDSELLGIAKAVHTELFGEPPMVEAIHAGLETGIIGEKFPGMDMISIGPTINNPHSPDEYVDVTTVVDYWRWVEALLVRLSS